MTPIQPMRTLLSPLVLLLAAGILAIGLQPPPVRADEGVPAPDFVFYKARVAPIVQGNCAECHAEPRKRLRRHFLRPRTGRKVRERDHERNFATILELIESGNPAGSVWLLKPLGPRPGGVEHGGGERIRMGDLAYGVMVDFINGATLPAESPAPPPVPPLPLRCSRRKGGPGRRSRCRWGSLSACGRTRTRSRAASWRPARTGARSKSAFARPRPACTA